MSRLKGTRESRQEGRGLAWLDDLARDVRFSVRSLRREPAYALVAALTIGLGVGATTSLFSVINAVLLRPLPVTEPARLFSVQEQRSGGRVSTGLEGMALPYARYKEYEAATRDVFSGLAAQRFRDLSLRLGDAPPLPVSGTLTSGNFFAVLGVRPAAGSFFTEDHQAAVVLGYRLWQERLGGTADVIGSTVRLNGRPMTVVGVAPRDFPGTTSLIFSDLWAPYGAHDAAGWSETWVTPVGRLRPGVEPERAQAVVDAAARFIPPEDPRTEVRGARLEAVQGVPANQRRAAFGFLGLLLAPALLVLLIGAANVAGMLLARTAARQREVAVRMAIGAGRGRLVRQFLAETGVLFLLGGGAGLVIAVWATSLLGRLRFPSLGPVRIEAAPDPGVLAAGLAVTAAVGVAFGLVPALQASRPAVAPTLREIDVRGGRNARARSAFVVAQLAMSVVLLVTAGLFTRTLQHAASVDPGFDAAHVLVATTDLAPHGYDEARGRQLYARLMERARALPGVESVALARVALLTGDSESYTARTDPDAPALSVGMNAVDGSYFRTMRLPLVAGRGIDEADAAGAPPVVVVNETLARQLWPGEDPLGKQLLRGDTRHEVVGVARDGAYVRIGEDLGGFTFLSAGQAYAPRQVLHLRLRPGADEEATLSALRVEVARLDPDVVVEGAMPLTAMMARTLLAQRFAATLIGGFGLLGLALAALGVYGVLSYQVARRRREIAIRFALGAERGDVVRLILGHGALLAGAGIAAGLALAAGLTRFLEALLHGVSPLDPVTLLGAALVLGAVALLASYLPARRALGAQPSEALRED